MRIEPKAKETLEKLHLISGFTIENIREVFESFLTLIVLNYLEGKETDIPFLGKFKLEYKGDRMNKKGKQAIVELNFKASDTLLKNIGQIEDKEQSDVAEMLIKKIRFHLHSYLNLDQK